MTPQTIETIRNTLEDAVETRGYELSSAQRAAKELAGHINKQARVRGNGKDTIVQQMLEELRTNNANLDAALKQFKLAETALVEFNATYPKGNET